MADSYLAGSGSLAGSLVDLTQTWNTTGTPTAIKLNVTDTASGGGSNLLDLRRNGLSELTLVAGNGLRLEGSFRFHFNNRSSIYSPADGILKLTNATATDFNLLQFGGTTSSFPALKRSGNSLIVRLADDSGGANLSANNLISNGYVQASTGSPFTWITRSSIFSPSDGVIGLYNNAATDFNRLQFGGTTSSFPAIKRNSAAIEVRLADDSARAGLIASYLNLDKTITASGTNGDQTINKAMGSVNFAAGALSYITVTNSLVSTDSVIIATVASNDSALKDVQVVASAGSFRIYPGATPAADTRVNFLVLN